MKFSESFINEVKELYPTWTELHRAVENGSVVKAGRMLCDGKGGEFSYQEILDASSIEMLHQKAMLAHRRHDLYSQFVTGMCFSDHPCNSCQNNSDCIYDIFESRESCEKVKSWNGEN